MLLVEILLGAVFLFWLSVAALSFWSYRGTLVVRPEHATEPLLAAPRVSILVPARNEEEILAAALRSMLKLDYPDFEVILVDDDSHDRTGLIADELAVQAESGGRLKVIHNRELPAGWGGKVHALSLAARAATGEWILATDADVIFHPSILRLGISCALRENARLVSFLPDLEIGSFWEKVVLPAFALLISTFCPIRLVNRPKYRRALAAGAFILMRRDDLEALGGYPGLRSTVVEDLRLAEMFKRHGRKTFVAATQGLFRTRMYKGGQETWEALSRILYEGTNFSVWKVLAAIFAGNLVALFPWVTALALSIRAAWQGRLPESDPALVLAFATCAMNALVYLPFLLFLRVTPIYVFTLPLASIFFSAAGANSAWASLFGRGVPWKGRRYRPPG